MGFSFVIFNKRFIWYKIDKPRNLFISKMSLASYVARRLLYDICDIATPVHSTHYENVYNELFYFMYRYTQYCGREIIPNLPIQRESFSELNNDMLDLYEGIFSASDDINSRLTLNSLFVMTYYMMVKYRDDPVLCSYITFQFEVTTERLGGWIFF